MQRNYRIVTFLLLMLTIAGSAMAQNSTETTYHLFTAKEFYSADAGKKLPYHFGVPKEQKKGKKKLPLVVMLHGAGERGAGNNKAFNFFTPYIDDANNLKNKPCYILMPQCPENEIWARKKWSLKPDTTPPSLKPSDNMATVFELIDNTLKSKPDIDSKRVYIIGLSMGGYGTFDAITLKPDLFAAAIPICGGAYLPDLKKICKLPVWIWHGAKDPVISVEHSSQAYEQLTECNTNRVKYTELPDVKHDSWKECLSSAETWDWLFKQRR